MQLWGIWNTPPLLSGPLGLAVVQPVRVPSMGQIELFDHLTACKQIINVK